MKKLKTMLALMLLVPVAIGFVGCGNNDNPKYTTFNVDNVSQLGEALTNAKNGDVIKLTDSLDITGTGLKVENVEITLDLNGNNLYGANKTGANVEVLADGKLILTDNSKKRDGKIYADTPYSSEYGTGLVKVVGGEFVMLGGNIEAVIEEDTASNGQFGVVATDGGKIDIRGGQIKTGWYAVSGNGTDEKADGSKYAPTTITISGGKVISTTDYAIYHPQDGVMTISGGEIDGAAGAISIRRGDVTISGGKFSSNGTGDVGDFNDGTSGLNNNLIDVTANYAKRFGDKANLVINDGEFIGTLAWNDVAGKEAGLKDESTFVINGGKFNLAPASDMLGAGKTIQIDGTGVRVVDIV